MKTRGSGGSKSGWGDEGAPLKTFENIGVNW